MANKQYLASGWAAPRSVSLPADLMKLKERYLAVFPAEGARVERLAQVPAAFRHLLTLRLELRRADALPNRYRELAGRQPGQALDETLAEPRVSGEAGVAGDVVDQLVAAFADTFGTKQAPDLLHRLRRYFTESQLVELTLVVALARAFAAFDALQPVLLGGALASTGLP